MKPFTLKEAEQFFKENADRFLNDKEMVASFGELRLPAGRKEAIQCQAILDILKEYEDRKNPPPPRPLSIALFGPPGSGKSFTVKELAELAQIKEKPHEINLSQLNSPDELGHALLNIFSLFKPNNTRIVFFDEFDTALQERWGWLRWFLAPMQDGQFYYAGKPIAIGKAVFVFAGGTANTLEDFNVDSDDKEYPVFVKQKGPDFLSRLHGFINIAGINTLNDERILRRSLALHFLLKKRSKKLDAESNGTRRINSNLLRSLLAGTHYKHGTRSMEALLDMSKLNNFEGTEFTADHLPLVELRKLHLSSGPFDGISIGISAGQNYRPASEDSFIKSFSKRLFEHGANLVHGGELLDNHPLKLMVNELKEMPNSLLDDANDKSPPPKRIKNFLAHPSELRCEVAATITSSDYDVVDVYHKSKGHITISDNELRQLDLGTESDSKPTYFKATGIKPGMAIAWAVSLFRNRFRMIQNSDALVVLGGKIAVKVDDPDDKIWGRFPGIAEEVMLAIAYHRPVYVLGMTGGAARSVGYYLGLSTTIQDVVPFPDELQLPSTPVVWEDSFTVPGKPNLPKTSKELKEFFESHGIDTPNWIDNGLSKKENQTLFHAADEKDGWEKSVELIIKGIENWSRKTSRAIVPFVK